MAIKISGTTIVNDSRVVENADKIGIGRTTPRYDLEILSDAVPTGIAVSVTSTQATETNKGLTIFNNGQTPTFTVSYKGRVDAEEYYGTFKGTIDPSVGIITSIIEQGNTSAEVIDTGSDGKFVVKTEGVERVIVDPSGYLNTRADIRLRRTASNDGGIYFGDSNNNYIFGADSVETLTLTGGSGNFIEGETVTGGSSGKTAIVKSWNSSSLELVIHDKTGSFQNGETVTSPSNTTGRAVQSFSTTNADVLTFATAGNERLRITSAGFIDIGGSSTAGIAGVTNPMLYAGFKQTGSAPNNTYGGVILGAGLNGNSPTISASKNNSGTALSLLFETDAKERLRIASDGSATFTGTNEQDIIHITTGGAAGNTFANIRGDNEAGIRIRGGGSIRGGTIELGGGLRDVDPGIIKFSTGALNAQNSERLRITADGHLKPGATDTYDIGTDANNRFRTVYAETFNGAFQGTADVAAKVAVADESTDTSCFPLFATAATGNLAAKSGSNLTFNSNTGALTATSFVGGLPITDGADNRIITATSASAIKGESNLTFDGTDLSVPSKIKHLGDTNTLIEFETDTINFDTAGSERLRIDSNGNIGVNATPATTGTLYTTVDHFLVIGDSDTGIAQDGDGEFEIWANNQEIVNFSTAGVDPKKSILPSGSIDIGSATTKISHGYFTNITADSITADITGSASKLDVTDDTTDTDGYLLFSNGTGADQSIKTNANIRYNASIGSLNLSKTNGGIKFGPGTAANDDAHIEWLGASNAGYLRIAVSDDQDAAATAEYIEFGDYSLTGGFNAGSQAFTQHVKIQRSEFLVRTGSNTISVVDRLKIDKNGNIGFNCDAATTGTLYTTVDHFIAIGDSDTGIAQDGDGQLEIWTDNQEIINFNTTQITPTKSIIPSVTDGSLNLGSTDNRWGTIYANTINGTITGTISNATDAVNAENVKVTQRDTAGTHYLTFVASDPSGTNLALYGDDDLQFNPSTNRLSAAEMKPGKIVDSSDGTGTENYVIKANASGGWSWGQVTGDSGVSLSFLNLSDTPSAFTADKVVKVNSNGDALIFADAGSLSNLAVKQYSDNKPTRTERSCKEPIGVVVDSGSVTIGIGTTSNAYGAKYVQDDDPTTSDGGSYSACEGDIWFDTSGAEPGSGTDNTTGAIVEANKFFQNSTSLTESTTFPASGTKNGGAFGPYEIANGVTFTINSGSTFTII